MLVYGSSQDAIIRYNISQNDGAKGKHILDFPVWVTPRGSGIIHNNVFYIGEGIDAVLVDEALQTARLYNNIVINKGSGALSIPSENQTALFRNNCLVGYSPAEASINQDPVEGDPGLVAPGTGDSLFASLEGYRLTPQSPCIRTGFPLSQMEGNYWFQEEMTDFWGNPADPESLDVGVHQLSGPAGMEASLSTNPGMIRWQAAPVPFTESFSLSMDALSPIEVCIKMYDTKGRYVDTLYSGELQSGINTLYYNPDDRLRSGMNPGMYLLQLTSPDLFLVESRVIIRN
jgi:hypothetical protein